MSATIPGDARQEPLRDLDLLAAVATEWGSASRRVTDVDATRAIRPLRGEAIGPIDRGVVEVAGEDPGESDPRGGEPWIDRPPLSGGGHRADVRDTVGLETPLETFGVDELVLWERDDGCRQSRDGKPPVHQPIKAPDVPADRQERGVKHHEVDILRALFRRSDRDIEMRDVMPSIASKRVEVVEDARPKRVPGRVVDDGDASDRGRLAQPARSR